MPSTAYTDITTGVASIQDRTNNAGADVDDVNGAELRLYARHLTGGIFEADDFVVVPGSGLSVGIGTDGEDVAVVPGTDPGQGNYIVRLGGAPPHNIALQAAHASLDRIDQIYLVVFDVAYDGGTLSLPRLARRTGDAAASPVGPGPDGAWSAYLLLATIFVSNGATGLVGGDITDERSLAGSTVEPTGQDAAISAAITAAQDAPGGSLYMDTAEDFSIDDITDVEATVESVNLPFPTATTTQEVWGTFAFERGNTVSGTPTNLTIRLKRNGVVFATKLFTAANWDSETSHDVHFHFRSTHGSNFGNFSATMQMNSGAVIEMDHVAFSIFGLRNS
jgi:hypothetical protein